MTTAHEWRRLYWWSFIARFTIGLLGWLLTQLADVPLLQDALHYEDLGSQVAQSWLAGEPSPWLSDALSHGHEPWLMIVFLAVCYCLAGGIKVTPLALFLYCLLTAWTPVLTARIAQQMGVPPRGVRLSGWLVAFSPAFVFWAGALYKEGLILVVLTLAIYHLLLVQESWQPRSLVILALCLPALFALRFYLALILGGVFFLGLLLGRPKRGQAESDVIIRQVALAAGFVTVLVALGFAEQAREALPTDVTAGLEQMDVSRRDLGSAPSGYLREQRVETPEEAIRFLPVGLGYFLTVPWPWDIGSLRQNLAIPETLVWVLMYPLILIGMREGLRTNARATLPLIVTSLAIACFYALWIANVGAAYRLRIQVWIFWAIFVGWGWCAIHRRPSEFPRSAGGLP